MTKKISLLALITLLGGCSLFGPKTQTAELENYGQEAPEIGDVLDSKPEGLVADEENSRHTNTILRGSSDANE